MGIAGVAGWGGRVGRTARAGCRLGLALCLGLGLVVFSGCAALVPPVPAQALLNDALFQHPPRPAEAQAVLALSPAMQQHLQALRQRVPRQADWPMALAESLVRAGPQNMRIDYDTSITRTAAQAFEARAGNCLSLVVMTAALAQGLGLEVGFQAVRSPDQFRSESGLTLRTGHVNVVLAPRAPSALWRNSIGELPRQHLVIDFLPMETAQDLPAEPIDAGRVLAMFMNNRAVEALLAQRPAEAYAWAREALAQDAGFLPGLNTLGVVYQRTGHLQAAAAVYEAVLARDGSQVPAVANLAQVREAQGDAAEAARLQRLLAALEPTPPLHHLQQGQAALAAGRWAEAVRHFQRELRQQADSHAAWFGLARAQLALGDAVAAAHALRRAEAASDTADTRRRYAGKLDALLRMQH